MIDCSHGQFLLLSLPGSPELGSKLGPGQETMFGADPQRRSIQISAGVWPRPAAARDTWLS